jgi:hypothetical protein
MIRVSVLRDERSDMAAFGPTPDTEMSSSKKRFSCRSANPYRSKLLSPMDSDIYSLAGAEAFTEEMVLREVLMKKPIPFTSSTRLLCPISATVPFR